MIGPEQVDIDYSSKQLDNGKKYEHLEAHRGSDFLGSFDYFWDPKFHHWDLEDLSVGEDFQGQGVDSALLREFSRRVGPDQLVYTVVTHDDTRSFLLSRYADQAELRGTYRVRGQELVEVPMARIFNRGRIRVEEIAIHYRPHKSDEEKEDAFRVRLRGATLPLIDPAPPAE